MRHNYFYFRKEKAKTETVLADMIEHEFYKNTIISCFAPYKNGVAALMIGDLSFYISSSYIHSILVHITCFKKRLLEIMSIRNSSVDDT